MIGNQARESYFGLIEVAQGAKLVVQIQAPVKKRLSTSDQIVGRNLCSQKTKLAIKSTRATITKLATYDNFQNGLVDAILDRQTFDRVFEVDQTIFLHDALQVIIDATLNRDGRNLVDGRKA